MAVSIRKLTPWRTEVDNRPGALADVLQPLADAGCDLHLLMGYRIPGRTQRAVIELAPVTGRRVAQAAQRAGLTAATSPTLLVVGDNRPGLASGIARALADSGVNIAFLVAQVLGRRYSALFGFESEADLDRAADRIRTAVTARPPRQGRLPRPRGSSRPVEARR
jgi:hypothetical protein